MRHSFLFIAILILLSCIREQYKYGSFQHETICKIQQPEELLGDLQSFSVMDSGCYVLSTTTQVYLYNQKGEVLNIIGANGRSETEYIMPFIVRTYGDNIFVWDAMNLRYSVYNTAGDFVETHQYQSAIGDFLVKDNLMYIYTAGARDNFIIDVLNLENSKIENSISIASEEHKALSRWLSLAPISFNEDKLYYMPKDQMKIFSYGKNEEIDEHLMFKSNTFISNHNKLSTDNIGDYINKNSLVCALTSWNSKFSILTLEGIFEQMNNQFVVENRFYTLYTIKSNQIDKATKIPFSEIHKSNLVYSTQGDIYYIYKSPSDTEDKFFIRRVIL